MTVAVSSSDYGWGRCCVCVCASSSYCCIVVFVGAMQDICGYLCLCFVSGFLCLCFISDYADVKENTKPPFIVKATLTIPVKEHTYNTAS